MTKHKHETIEAEISQLESEAHDPQEFSKADGPARVRAATEACKILMTRLNALPSARENYPRPMIHA